MHFAILRDHSLKSELFRALRRDRHADQSAPVHGHEVYRLRRRLLRRHDEVAFILAIGVVGHDHNPAGGDIAQDIVDGIELHDFGSLGNHCVNITSRVLFGNSVAAPPGASAHRVYLSYHAVAAGLNRRDLPASRESALVTKLPFIKETPNCSINKQPERSGFENWIVCFKDLKLYFKISYLCAYAIGFPCLHVDLTR